MKEDHLHHNHQHNEPIKNVNLAFIIGILLNFLFVVVEVVVGLFNNSLALLSDAGHNLADVAALALSLLAFRFLKVKSTKKYTYGYRKTSILVALFNSFVLLISIGAIAYQAVYRFIVPVAIDGSKIALVAGIGIAVNAVTALMFLRDKEKDLNIKSAYLHLMSDAVVSLGIVAGGIILYYTGYYWIDSALSVVVVVVILFSTWKLLRSSLRLSLDGIPDHIRIDNIKATTLKIEGVKSIHHIHVWAISTTENALTAHLVLSRDVTIDEEISIKQQVKQTLNLQNIQHVTLETERGLQDCETEECI
jgi:cobalt-zinc-cadmium efflux system protein